MFCSNGSTGFGGSTTTTSISFAGLSYFVSSVMTGTTYLTLGGLEMGTSEIFFCLNSGSGKTVISKLTVISLIAPPVSLKATFYLIFPPNSPILNSTSPSKIFLPPGLSVPNIEIPASFS